MGGFAKAGVVLVSGANVAVQGVLPAGMAGAGSEIWQAGGGAPVIPWELIGTVQAANTGTSPAMDTTGATLLVVVVATYWNGTSFSDSVGNIYILGANTGGGGNGGSSFIYYCLNPVTSSSHTITGGVGNYTGYALMAFKGPSSATDQSSGVIISSGTSITNVPITPTAPNSLIITGTSTNGAGGVVGIDSGFTIDASTTSSLMVGGAAHLVQSVAATVGPTWTFTNDVGGRGSAVLMNFIPFTLIDSSLIDFWPMNEGTGTTFNNLVNATNYMTASNITWATSSGFVNAPTPQFNGSSSVALSAQNNTLDGPFSLCIAVIRSVASGDGYSILLRSLTPSPVYRGFQFYIDPSNNLVLNIINTYVNSLNVMVQTGGIITLNTSFYVCATYDGSGVATGIKIYVNGAQVSTSTMSNSFSGSFLSNLPIYTGGNESGSNYLWGTIANARIYNRVLTAAEVATLYSTMGK